MSGFDPSGKDDAAPPGALPPGPGPDQGPPAAPEQAASPPPAQAPSGPSAQAAPPEQAPSAAPEQAPAALPVQASSAAPNQPPAAAEQGPFAAPLAPLAGQSAPGPTVLAAPVSTALQDPAAQPAAPVEPATGEPQLPPAPVPRVTFRDRIRKVGGWFARLGAGIEAVTVGLARAGASWLPWPITLGLALGGAVWAFAHRQRWTELFTNKMPNPVRYWSTAWLGGGVLLVFLALTVVHLVVRRREAITFPGTVQRWGPRLSFLFVLPIAATFLAPEMNKEPGSVALLHCALGAAALLLSAYSWLSPTRPAPPAGAPAPAAGLPVSPTLEEGAPPAPAKRPGRLGAWLGGGWISLLWAGHATLFSYFALVQHRSLSTRTIDLGYYDNIFYQSIHGRWLACSFLKTGNHAAAHFDPILVVLSPLYLIYPRAELLLVLQAVWIGSGVIPAYLIANRRLGSRLAAGALALAYVLHPALQGANMYEFHSLSLVAPVFLWLANFLEKGSRAGYFLTLVVLLLCREDAALLSFFVGLAAVLAPGVLTASEDAQGASPEARELGEKRRRRMGVITLFVSTAYFVVVKAFFMRSPDILNSGKDAYSFAYYYEALIPAGTGMGGMILSILGNPMFVIRHVFTEPKLVYFGTVFLPVLFLPFGVKAGRWVLAYGLIFCLLASRTAVFSTHFQYATLLYPAAVAFTPAALVALRRRPAGFLGGIDVPRLARALVPALVMATLLVSWQFGAIVPNGRFKGGFVGLRRVLTAEDKASYAWLKDAAANIPRDARVSVTDRIGPHVSNRRHAYFYPARTDVDFVFIDEGDLKGNDQNRHKTIVGKGTFKEVTRRGKMVLYKKK